MQVIVPDFLADLRDLPILAMVIVAFVGLSLWTCGWWLHRFWMSLLTSLAAGLIGLQVGPDLGVQPLVAGLLLAIAAGCLSLALARIGVFLTYGITVWYVLQAVAPKASSPLICITVGGICAVLVFRFAVTLLTSAVGAWMLAHGGLLLAEKAAKFDALEWLARQKTWVNIGFATAVFAGVIWQFWADRAMQRYRKKRKEWLDWVNKQQQAAKQQAKESPKKGWLIPFKRAA